MKLRATIFLSGLVFLFSTSHAQSNYFGVGLATYSNFHTQIAVPTFQIGTIMDENIELRASLDTLIFLNVLSTDILFTQVVPENELRYYLGGGLDLALFLIPNITTFAAILASHLTIGLEHFRESIGFFGELQPILGIDGVVYGRLRFGINIGF